MQLLSLTDVDLKHHVNDLPLEVNRDVILVIEVEVEWII